MKRAMVDGFDREDKDLMDSLLQVYKDKDAEFKISRNHMKIFFHVDAGKVNWEAKPGFIMYFAHPLLCVPTVPFNPL
ncbi:hypothetical protein JCGZ_16724 [Jatropha curcas]|uniref:Uncharacterized protein n=1 Tax=Jatropha curcas TaxID=180498 RepID=A0A067L4T6_JATCU|nr:hypothetical protein JCGZ_16724 [Jatropha curcas]